MDNMMLKSNTNTLKFILVSAFAVLVIAGIAFGVYKKKQLESQPLIEITQKASELSESERLAILNQLSEKDVLDESSKVLDAVNKLSQESASSNLTDAQKQKILDSLSK